MKYNKMMIIGIIAILLLTSCGKTNESGTENTENSNSNNIEENINSKDEIEYFTVTDGTPMENRGLLLEIIGSAVYDKIEGNDFTDTPLEGNQYLVLYLSIRNTTGKGDYFNYNNLSTKLDGQDITDTFLVNNPLKYTTIKTHLANNMITQGYLVWEVPENWDKLEVTYTGWTENLYTEPTIVITPEDLGEPEEYKEDNRIF